MGYDLHITRQESWFDDDPERKIGLDEWLTILASHPDMQLDPDATETTSSGETLHAESLGLAIWAGYRGPGKDGATPLFHFADGNIDVKNPDDEIIRQMLHIAEKLGAKVVGDDEETYGLTRDGTITRGEAGPELAPDPPEQPAAAPRRPWWKVW